MSVGTSVGISVGTSVGMSVGTSVGMSVGTSVGTSVRRVGHAVGLAPLAHIAILEGEDTEEGKMSYGAHAHGFLKLLQLYAVGITGRLGRIRR